MQLMGIKLLLSPAMNCCEVCGISMKNTSLDETACHVLCPDYKKMNFYQSCVLADESFLKMGQKCIRFGIRC